MIKVIQSISRLLTSHSSAFVIAAAIAAWCFPILFTWVRGDVSSLILGFIMLTMGLTLTHADFRILFSPNRSLEKVSCHFLMAAIRKTVLYMLDL